jgi:hypothetical protein
MYIFKHFTGKHTVYKGFQISEIMFTITVNTIQKELNKQTTKKRNI